MDKFAMRELIARASHHGVFNCVYIFLIKQNGKHFRFTISLVQRIEPTSIR